MKLIERGSGRTIAETVELANSFATRARGLLFRTGIAKDHALVLFDTNSIHMFMMLFTIDVVFLDGDRKIVRLCPRRRPFSFPVMAWGAKYAVEMADGRIAESGLQVGDVLSWD